MSTLRSFRDDIDGDGDDKVYVSESLYCQQNEKKVRVEVHLDTKLTDLVAAVHNSFYLITRLM